MMDRTEFEKIVGKDAILNEDFSIYWEGGDQWDAPKVRLCVFDTDVVAVILDHMTPFRLRCLLHGLGIKCDWDEPVTFERLIALPGATEFSDSVEFGTREKRVQIHCPGYDTDPDEATYFFVALAGCSTIDLETMRQVHLLLEASCNEKT